MNIKSKFGLILFLTLTMYFNQNVFAINVIHAGNDTVICSGSNMILGGTPTASGNAPFQYV